MSDFMEVFNFKSLTKGPTCFKNTNKRINFFKNPSKPSCMDLILTNRKKKFMPSALIEMGGSDFYKMVVTILKHSLEKLKLRSSNTEVIKISAMIVLGNSYWKS